jgi:hypothetical protein
MSISLQINELNSQFKTFPKKLKITTATITCKVPTVIFNIENIGLYFNNFDDVLIGKKYGNRKDKKKPKENSNINKINLNNNEQTIENKNEQTIENKNEQTIENKNEQTIENKNEQIIENKNEQTIENKNEQIIENNENKFIIKDDDDDDENKGKKKKKVPKELSKKNKKKENNFYNQVSLIFRTSKLMGIRDEDLTKKDMEKNINVKLFINGSIHMTGCKHFSNIIKVLEIIFEKIVNVKSYYNKNEKCFKKIYFVNSYDPKEVIKKKKEYQIENKKINQDKFLTKIYEELKLGNIDKLSLDDVKKFKIGMINTNFNIGFKINREMLCKKMAEHNISVNFESISHASVDSKIHILHLNKKISIFVFESGSITIAGSKSYDQIRYGYEFINKFILENYFDLYVKQITPQVLLEIIKNMKK